MIVKCVVACHNASGTPDLFFCKVRCSEAEYDVGDHYDKAEGYAQEQGYSGPMVVFDENDGPKTLFDLFVWKSASVV